MTLATESSPNSSPMRSDARISSLSGENASCPVALTSCVLR
jgi:hypothetical protein